MTTTTNAAGRWPRRATRATRDLVITTVATLLAVLALLAAGPAAAQAATPEDDRPPTAVRTQVAVDCAYAAIDAGWTGDDLVISVAVALAESDCIADATHDVVGGECDGSVDRGAWQINDCYWPIDMDQWDDIQYSADYSHDEIWPVLGWEGWTTYNNGMYLDRMGEAQAAVDEAQGGGDDVTGVVTTEGYDLFVRDAPNTAGEIVGALADGTTVTISCQTEGEWVYSEVYDFWTNLWDQVGPGEYVSDAYVDTGSNDPVAPAC